MRSWWDDFKFGARLLTKHPLWTLSAVLALAIGIAFNGTLFSVSDSLLFRPLLVPDMDRVVLVEGRRTDTGQGRRALSPVAYQALQSRLQSLETLAATEAWEASLTGESQPQRVRAFRVTSSFFTVTAVAPEAGRLFAAADDRLGGPKVAILSHAVWEQRFGRDASAVGRTIRLNGETYTVVGVMPDHFRFPLTAELWVPMAFTPEQQASETGSLKLIGRLRTGISRETAQAEVQSVLSELAARYPRSHGHLTGDVRPGYTEIVSDLTREYTVMMLGAAVFLLLICCANVANLQFARFLGRTREMSVRSALGAGRLRLVRQLLSESALLALFGGAASLVIAFWCVDLVRGSMPPEVEQFLPGWHRMSLNGRAMGYSALASILAAILAGLAPALFLSRSPLVEHLKESSRGAAGSRSRHRLRDVLVISQIALALVLLTGAALMIKGVGSILNLWPNLEPERVLTLRLGLPDSRYPGDDRKEQFQSRLLDGLRTLSGVESAALASGLPESQHAMSTPVRVEGRDVPDQAELVAYYQSIDAGYFSTLRIPRIEGRFFQPFDGSGSEPVAILSADLAARLFPGEGALGRRVAFGLRSGPSPWLTVVGVVTDVSQDYTDRSRRGVLYTHYRQFPERAFDVALRARANPLDLASATRDAVAAIDPDQPVYDLRTYHRLVQHNLAGIAYVAGTLGVLGLTALFLAALGVYSLMAYAVEERTREIGVRLALGASRDQILWMVMRHGVGLAAAGLFLGLFLASVLVRWLSGLVFGVSPADMVAFGAVPVLLVLSAMTACYLPASRATRTDPTLALRHD